jgi:glycosyltransferase involved in cell wall biosynthesis
MGLRERGLEVDVFSVSRPTAAEAGDALQATRGLRIEYISRLTALMSLARLAPRRVLEFNALLQRESTRKSRSWLRLARALSLASRVHSGGYSRIHSHWPYGHQLSALAHLLTGIPSSISVHAHEVAYDNGHFSAVFELIDFAAFCNDAARSFLLERLHRSNASKCHLIYHGVDLAAFPALAPPPESSRLRLVSAGRLTPTKGFSRLLRLVAELESRGVSAELTLVGDGGQREPLLRLAAELGISDRVQLTGWLEPSALRKVFAANDVFCLLADTTYHDGLPNVVLEAQALGRPVLLSNLPAATEAVTHGVDGFVVEPEDTEAACSVLMQLARQPALRLGLAAAARARIERQHDSRCHLDALHQLLLSNSGTRC